MDGIHIMLDLETCGTDPDTTILSIGAQVFYIKDKQVLKDLGPSFYVVVDFTSYDSRFTINPSTILWWMQQSEEARKAIFLAPEKLHIKDALDRFVKWCSSFGGAKYWSQGKDFDIVIMQTSLKVFDMECPWKYWNTMDTRTIYALANLDYRSVPLSNYPAHHALGDCVRQIDALRICFSKF